MQYAIPYLSIEKAATHTHHKNSYPAPSAEDIYQLIKKRKENKDFAGSFIVAFNGEKYALSITDWEKARNFLNTEGAFFDGTTWKEDSEIGKAFKKATRFFKDKYDGNVYTGLPVYFLP